VKRKKKLNQNYSKMFIIFMVTVLIIVMKDLNDQIICKKAKHLTTGKITKAISLMDKSMCKNKNEFFYAKQSKEQMNHQRIKE
jgi:hypothetical protein